MDTAAFIVLALISGALIGMRISQSRVMRAEAEAKYCREQQQAADEALAVYESEYKHAYSLIDALSYPLKINALLSKAGSENVSSHN